MQPFHAYPVCVTHIWQVSEQKFELKEKKWKKRFVINLMSFEFQRKFIFIIMNAFFFTSGLQVSYQKRKRFYFSKNINSHWMNSCFFFETMLCIQFFVLTWKFALAAFCRKIKMLSIGLTFFVAFCHSYFCDSTLSIFFSEFDIFFYFLCMSSIYYTVEIFFAWFIYWAANSLNNVFFFSQIQTHEMTERSSYTS